MNRRPSFLMLIFAVVCLMLAGCSKPKMSSTATVPFVGSVSHAKLASTSVKVRASDNKSVQQSIYDVDDDLETVRLLVEKALSPAWTRQQSVAENGSDRFSFTNATKANIVIFQPSNDPNKVQILVNETVDEKK